MTSTDQPPKAASAVVDTDTIAALRTSSTATISTQLFKRGLRNTVLAGLRPVNPANARFAGQAYTLRYIPAREDLDVVSVFDDYDHPQRSAVESVPPGQVLVMDSRREPRAATAGDLLLTRLQVRGAAAVVTDGAFRDSPAIAALDLPAYSAGSSPMTNLALHHAVDQQVPIGCAGVAIYPGDILVGDGDGVVCVPAELAADVAEDCVAQEGLEAFIRRRLLNGAPLRGTYPPDAALLAEFHRGHEGPNP